MNIRKYIKQNPFAVQAQQTLTTVVQGLSNRKVLRQLASTPYSQGVQIAEAINLLQRKLSHPDREWIGKIEAERKRLLGRGDPLIDGSLGEGGLYDKGKTIQRVCMASKPAKQALLLFWLTRVLKPLSVIELGTNVGISSAYIGAALKLNRQNGRMITLDASPYRQRLAKEVHRNVGIDNISCVEGLFTDTLIPSSKELGAIEMAFIDGHHLYQPTLDYFEEILKLSASNAVFIFDDIRWSDGMRKAWSEIQADDRLGVVVDLGSVGVSSRRQADISRRFVLDPISAF